MLVITSLSPFYCENKIHVHVFCTNFIISKYVEIDKVYIYIYITQLKTEIQTVYMRNIEPLIVPSGKSQSNYMYVYSYLQHDKAIRAMVGMDP